jgi:hypothetical protein
MDLGCGIRLPIGVALINAKPGSHARLEMGFYPSVDQSGAVKLTAILQKVDMGQFAAFVTGIGTALEILGVSAWIGFLIDVILSAILSNKLPSVLRDEVKKYLGQNQWVLMRFGQLLNDTYALQNSPIKYAAAFDVEGDTMLASIAV